MSKQANPMAVGLFVIGAVVIGVVAMILFGTSKTVDKSFRYIAYFEESVGGLDVGAPVEFRGVRVGTVADVDMEVDAETLQLRIPVTIQFEPRESSKLTPEERRATIADHIKRGVKAQLESASILTGKLKVVLDFHPDVPIRHVAPPDDPYPEMPTIASPLTLATRTLADLPVAELVNSTRDAVSGLSALINSSDTSNAVLSADRFVRNADILIQNINEKLDTLSHGLDARTTSLSMALTNSLAIVESSAANIEERVGKLMEEMTRVMANVADMTDEDSALRFRLGPAIAELTAAAKAVRSMADMIERRPEALLKGK